eukprot:2528409-Amphidinium_carterae.1
MEWLIDNADDVVVIGLMYRELGYLADPSIYGELVTGVGHGVRLAGQPEALQGPQYEWTDILAESHRARNLLLQHR